MTWSQAGAWLGSPSTQIERRLASQMSGNSLSAATPAMRPFCRNRLPVRFNLKVALGAMGIASTPYLQARTLAQAEQNWKFPVTLQSFGYAAGTLLNSRASSQRSLS